jgi:inosose dehydratase
MTPPDRTKGIKLGVATYSFNTLSIEQIIPILISLDVKTAGVFRAHVPIATGTPEECSAAVKKFTDAGIRVVSTGVVTLPNEEAPVRKAFENIRASGMNKFTAKPAIEALPLVEKFAKEFDVKVAIHNHGPTDTYPGAADVIKAIKPFDRRIGLCHDISHGWLANEDPAAAIRAAGDRLFEVHLRDTKGPIDGTSRDAGPVAVGRGLIDIKAVLAALIAVKFTGDALFEYEEAVPNKLPGVAESLGYVRGMLAAM